MSVLEAIIAWVLVVLFFLALLLLIDARADRRAQRAKRKTGEFER